MQLDSIQAKLAELLVPSREPGFFSQLWGIVQEPAEVRALALSALLHELSPSGTSAATPTRGAALSPYFDAACRELEANLDVVSELRGKRAHPPFAYICWLWKVAQVLSGLSRDGWLQPSWPTPPAAKPTPPTSASWLLRLPLEPLEPPLRTGPRLLGLAVAPLLEMASRETEQLGRRRRLLEAARRVLLETAAKVPQLPGAVQARSLAITEQIRQLNQWQAAGLDPEVDVSHQLQGAIARRDPERVTLLLESLDVLSRGSPRPLPYAKRLREARRSVVERFERFARPPSLEQLTRDTFGQTAARALQRGSARAVAEIDATPAAEGELVRAGTAVDGAFELGRSVAAVRVLEVQRRMAQVEFPTQTQVLSSARAVSDLPQSLIGDPRLLLLDFASNALLTRRYLAERKQRRASAQRYSEGRYYLLDGSASMSGRRGRMRDAILIAELSSMIRHLEAGNALARPIVYYRYFSKTSEPLIKAASIEEACGAIEAVLVRKSRGETDIQGALLRAFEELREERNRDSTLKRAQLVLVTDGVAELDLGRVWAARQQALDLPVQVSVIALGSENEALKQLAAAQTARGEAVFYHYLSDETLYRMSRGVRVQPGPSALPQSPRFPTRQGPPAAPGASTPEPRELAGDADDEAETEVWRELDGLVDELRVLREPPDLDGLAQAEQLGAAYAELGMSLDDVGLEAERARCDARRRDLRGLVARFDRWFPARLPPPAQASCPAELLEVIEVALLSVVELVSYLSGAPLQRRVDAIELLERLLCEAGVSPWEYGRALAFASAGSRAAIAQLRASVSDRGA